MAAKLFFILAIGYFFASPVASNEVTDEVNKIIDEVKAEIEATKAKINQEGAAVQAEVSGVLTNAYHSLDSKVEEAVQKAAAAGIDISECTKALNTTATTDINKRTDGAVHCITDEMTKALNDVEQELNAVEKAEKDVQDGEDALHACNKLSTWKKVKCVAQETAKLVSEAKDIKNEMVTAEKNLMDIAANYTQHIKTCENVQLQGTESDATGAGKDFVLCVVAKGVGL